MYMYVMLFRMILKYLECIYIYVKCFENFVNIFIFEYFVY